jgi:TrkA domain protein
VDVEERVLPGLGLAHDFGTQDGRRVGVVSRRTGERELVLYDRNDQDCASDHLVLTNREAELLAGLLGTTPVGTDLDSEHQDLAGVTSKRIPIPPGSPYDGRVLGDTRARTRTGASIVAVVRGGQVLPSPRPDAGLRAGDVLVVIGTPAGTAAVADLLRHG